MKLIATFVCFAWMALAGESISRSRHWLEAGGSLTAASSAAPVEIARGLMRARQAEIGIRAGSLDAIYLYKEYKTAHNGVTHLIFRQRFEDIDVHGAEWTVNIDRDGRVLNAGGMLFDAPAATVLLPSTLMAGKAVHTAVTAVDPKAAEAYYPFATKSSASGRSATFHRGALGGEVPAEQVWYAVRDRLAPAWKITVPASDGIEVEEVIVNGEGDRVLAQQSLTMRQNAGKPQGLVYEWSPVANPKPGLPREGDVQFVPRKLVSFAGDPVASPRGWVATNETVGNNTITGLNPRGLSCTAIDNCPFRPETVSAPNLDFSFPLEIGLGAANPTAYGQASTVNLFYLVNRVHDLFYQYGFDEAAGNFQLENFTGQGVGGDPVYAYAQFGAAAGIRPSLNNASFSIPAQDGIAPRMNMFLNIGIPGQESGFFTDGSLDAEVVFHEYTHGVTGRLARQLYTTHQGRSMGEGLSEFFALEFALPDGAPADGIYPTSEYFLFQVGRGANSRPYTTQMDVNPLTFENLGNVIQQPEVHADGEIFTQALMEVRANMIRQFGDREGRRRLRFIMIDAFKLAPPAAGMLDMRDAVLLADSVNFKGDSQSQIWAGFARRGLGVLAQSANGDSLHISASYEMPSPKASIRLYEQKYVIFQTVSIVLQDANNTRPTAVVTVTASSGDREPVTLRRKGSVYLGTIGTGLGASPPNSGALGLLAGDTITASYNDSDTGSGPGKAEVTVETSYLYTDTYVSPQPGGLQFANEQALGIRGGAGTFTRLGLPFEFPFFEKKHSFVRVYADGLLTFGMVNVSPCRDLEGLSRNAAIAPLWTGMRTNALPTHNVFFSRTEDSATFRWAGQTAPIFATQAPDPVNFAVRLYTDGRIQFFYGAGNKNLTLGSQDSTGCPAGTAVVGISNGQETFVQSSIHDGAGNLENALSVQWQPPFANLGGSDGVLENPVEGQAVDGVIGIQGIAYEVELSLGQPRLDFLLDGRAIPTSAVPNLQRPDFCQTSRVPRCPAVGFRQTLDPVTLNIAPGPHRLQVRATNWRGVSTVFPPEPRTFIVSGRPGRLPEGAIESPRANETVSGDVTVRGYAYAKDLLITAVDVLVDGVTYGRALYGIVRNDICGTAPGANCNTVGFQFLLDTRTGAVLLPNGKHTLTIRVQDESGRVTVVGSPVEFTVNNANLEPPSGVLASPRHNETVQGVMRISGHAWDKTGRIISAILVVDGQSSFALTYGAPRPEECAALSGVRACPSIGFEGTVDTRRFANGPHILAVWVTNDRGATTTFPLVNSNGINVFVSNP